MVKNAEFRAKQAFLRRRFGLTGGTRKTLEEVGASKFRVTREECDSTKQRHWEKLRNKALEKIEKAVYAR